jgi:2-oxoisovalerate dehydrogenase E2 component (dihydrolipoyl transacylase)
LAVQQFKLADIGEGIAEVQLTEWFVKEGDMVKEMDNVCAVESDKASVELTSPYTGKVVKVHHKVQDMVKVGSVLIDVDAAGPASDAASAPKPAPAKPSGAAPAAAAATAVQQFKLADIGEGIAEVQLTEWFVKEGDEVKEMDNLCAVESDKASVELTSPYSGKIVKLHYQTQETVKVGSVLVDIAAAGVAAPASAATKSSTAPTKPPPAAAAAAAAAASKIESFKLADIGEGIAEVQLTELFVKEGDVVNEMDNLCAVESDKASVELTSPFTGKVVKVHHKVSDTVKVGSVLVDIEVAGTGQVAAPVEVPTTPAPTQTPVPAVTSGQTPAAPSSDLRAPGVLATPKVRHLAREKGVDLKNIVGSGPMGRVLESDVVAATTAVAAAAPTSKVASAPAVATDIARPPVRNAQDQFVEIKDMVGKGMVKSMTDALKLPYMALGEEIDLTDLLKLQKALKEHAAKKYGVKPSVTSFMIKALSMALHDHPKINSKFGSQDANPPNYTIFGSHNICIAIDTPHGLVVPNIKDVGNLSVVEIQQEVARLAGLAMDNKLGINDIKGGTITLSNIGVIGTKDPRPIIFDGQAVIGASGRTMTLPRYNERMELEPRQIMNIRWVGDHRHIDGATLARFSNSFKRFLEEPGDWMLALR